MLVFTDYKVLEHESGRYLEIVDAGSKPERVYITEPGEVEVSSRYSGGVYLNFICGCETDNGVCQTLVMNMPVDLSQGEPQFYTSSGSLYGNFECPTCGHTREFETEIVR
jgi:hypothetical protein